MAKINRIQPQHLTDSRPSGYSHVVTAQGGTHVFISGQLPIDETGAPVGRGDIGAQAQQVMKNLGAALASVSATFDDVVKITIFVVDYKPADRARILEVRKQYIASDKAPASTLIGVQALAAEDFLIEIEAVAVIG